MGQLIVFQQINIKNNAIEKGYNYSIYYLRLFHLRRNFVFIDETGLGHKMVNLSAGNLKKLQDVYINTKVKRNLNSWTIGLGNLFAFKIVIGTISSNIFKDFLFELVKLRRQHQNDSFFIVLDNSIWYSQDKKIKIIYESVDQLFLPICSLKTKSLKKHWNQVKIKSKNIEAEKLIDCTIFLKTSYLNKRFLKQVYSGEIYQNITSTLVNQTKNLTNHLEKNHFHSRWQIQYLIVKNF